MTNLKALLFIISFLTVFSSLTYAQEQLSEEMKAYYDYCLDIREGVGKKDASMLKKCLDAWQDSMGETKLNFSGTDFTISATTDVKRVDGKEEMSLRGHVMFTPEYVDSLLAYDIDLEKTPVFEPEQMKGGPSDCSYEHVVLPANQKVSYKAMGGKDMELFAITEYEGAINMSVQIDADKKIYKQVSDTGYKAPILKWDMEYGTYILTLENKTNKEISVVIVTN